MPFLSKAQAAWGHTPEGEKALGGKDKVAEWDSGTNYDKLPGHVIPKAKKKAVLKEIIKKAK